MILFTLLLAVTTAVPVPTKPAINFDKPREVKNEDLFVLTETFIGHRL